MNRIGSAIEITNLKKNTWDDRFCIFLIGLWGILAWCIYKYAHRTSAFIYLKIWKIPANSGNQKCQYWQISILTLLPIN